MGEPISNNNSYVNFKGVTFRRDQLSDNQFIDGKPCVNLSGIVVPMNGNAYESYSVTLKDGTKVQFAEQSLENDARVIMGNNGVVTFDNIDNAIVFDTPKDDYYSFTRCSNVTVFAKRDETKTVGHSIGGGIHYKEHDIVISEDHDTITTNFCENMEIVHTGGADTVNEEQSLNRVRKAIDGFSEAFEPPVTINNFIGKITDFFFNFDNVKWK